VERNLKTGQNPPRVVALVEEEEEEEGEEGKDIRNWREKYKDRGLWNEILKQVKPNTCCTAG
jgi:hypothetical protein